MGYSEYCSEQREKSKRSRALANNADIISAGDIVRAEVVVRDVNAALGKVANVLSALNAIIANRVIRNMLAAL